MVATYHPSTPIRVGIIGLSSKAGTWAVRAHLPHLVQSPNFEIVAVCNSSLESSRAAIQAHGLNSATTQAYSNPEELAKDPNVDLYVVSTRVDTHHAALLPALKAGKKNIYVEWPLASNPAQAAELVELAHQNQVRTMVGLQGRASPSVLKVKEIVDSGRLGRINSVNILSASNIIQNNAVAERFSFVMDRKVGSNPLTVYGGHILDAVFFAVGELQSGPGKVHCIAGNLRPKMKIRKEDGSISQELYEKTTQDQMMLQGRLARDPAAMLTLHLRAGENPVDGPGTVWTIYGEKGELRVEWEGPGPHSRPAMSIKMSNFEQNVIEDVSWDEGGSRWASLPVPAQNVGHLYELFAEGKGYADWDVALKRQELLESFYDDFE